MDQFELNQKTDAPSLRNIPRAYLDFGLVVVDAKGQICGCNPEAERLAHFESGTMLGKSVNSLPGPLREVMVGSLDLPKRPDQKIFFPAKAAIDISITPIAGQTGQVT